MAGIVDTVGALEGNGYEISWTRLASRRGEFVGAFADLLGLSPSVIEDGAAEAGIELCSVFEIAV